MSDSHSCLPDNKRKKTGRMTDITEAGEKHDFGLTM